MEKYREASSVEKDNLSQDVYEEFNAQKLPLLESVLAAQSNSLELVGLDDLNAISIDFLTPDEWKIAREARGLSEEEARNRNLYDPYFKIYMKANDVLKEIQKDKFTRREEQRERDFGSSKRIRVEIKNVPGQHKSFGPKTAQEIASGEKRLDGTSQIDPALYQDSEERAKEVEAINKKAAEERNFWIKMLGLNADATNDDISNRIRMAAAESFR